jgi:hypothetical protein
VTNGDGEARGRRLECIAVEDFLRKAKLTADRTVREVVLKDACAGEPGIELDESL